MRYTASEISKEAKTEAYRIYVTDILKGAFGANERYIDLIKPQIGESKKTKNTDPEAIIDGIMRRTGIKETNGKEGGEPIGHT